MLPALSCDASRLDTNNASILNHLAHHFLITGEYDKVLHLANAAFNLKENGPVRAESCYLIASAYHAKVRTFLHGSRPEGGVCGRTGCFTSSSVICVG